MHYSNLKQGSWAFSTKQIWGVRLPLLQAPQMTDKGVLYQKMIPRYHWPLSKNVMLLTQSVRFYLKWTLNGPTSSEKTLGRLPTSHCWCDFLPDFIVANKKKFKNIYTLTLQIGWPGQNTVVGWNYIPVNMHVHSMPTWVLSLNTFAN